MRHGSLETSVCQHHICFVLSDLNLHGEGGTCDHVYNRLGGSTVKVTKKHLKNV